MATLVRSLAQDSKANFLLLFRSKQEEITLIDQHGQQRIIHAPAKKQDNPIRMLGTVRARQWLFILSALLAVVADLLDFFMLTIQSKKLATYYDTSKEGISKAVTYTLLMRPVGSMLFGVLGDYIGRKYPLVMICFFLGFFQMCSIFCTNLNAFLGLRALFGVAAGGIFGNVAALVMDGSPTQARGMMSGALGAANPIGYLIASGIALCFGDEVTSWKPSFWVSAGVSIFAGLVRLVLPETSQSGVDSRMVETGQDFDRRAPLRGTAKAKHFLRELKVVLKTSWKRVFFMALLVTNIMCVQHVAFDSYTTFTIVARGMDGNTANKLGMVTKSGGIIGAVVMGGMSQYIGRRRALLACCLFTLLLAPAYILPASFGGLAAGGFFFNFFGCSLSGLMPVYLNELSPPAFRTLMPGVSFEIAALLSAGSTQLVNALSESHRTTFHGKTVEAYGPVMLILIIVCSFQLAQLVAVGPENDGAALSAVERPSPSAHDNTYQDATPMTTFHLRSPPISRHDTFSSTEKV